MKKFAFRLDSVLRVREFELERARVTLGLVEAEHAKRQKKLREANERLHTGLSLLEAEMATGADGPRLAMRAAGIVIARSQLAGAKGRVAELTRPLAEARRLVAHRHTRVRSLERLRERAQERHQREGMAMEQAELEELAIGRIARARNEARRIMEGRFE